MHAFLEASTTQILHGDVVLIIGHGDVIDGNDARMGELGYGTPFTDKPLSEIGIGRKRGTGATVPRRIAETTDRRPAMRVKTSAQAGGYPFTG